MRSSAPSNERDRIARRSGLVFLLSVGATGIVLIVGFGLVMSACANSVSSLVDSVFTPGLGQRLSSDQVRPISIPDEACPYLRLVSAAAVNAGAPWREGMQPSADWDRFAAELTAPLRDLDAALAAAVPHVPAALADDLRVVRDDVRVGRVELFTATSVEDYMNRSNVLEGYTTLGHADRLVAGACGVKLAPPLPF